MKNIIFISFAITFLLSSCNKKQTAVISGVISQHKNTPLFVFDSRLTSSPDTLELKDSTFNIEFPLGNPVYVQFRYGNLNKEIFLAPGYSIKITCKASDPSETFQMEGKGAAENEILSVTRKEWQNLDYNRFYKSNFEKANQYLDSIFEVFYENLESRLDGQKVDPEFVLLEKKSLQYKQASLKLTVCNINNVKDSSCYTFLQKITIEDENYLGMPEYRNFITNYISDKAQEILAEDDSTQTNPITAWYDVQLDAIDHLDNKKIKDYLVYSSLADFLGYYGVKNFAKYNDYFANHVTDADYVKEFRKIYQKKLLIAPGQPAPEFSCVDIQNNTYSLSGFKGKYIYIDFWATWCGPCRQELPEYIRLYDEYKDKDIVFVSISLDDNKKSWEKSVNEHKPEYKSLIAENGWNSKVAKAYQIAGIPTFVLIDREGKIIDSQAPRPSSSEIRPTLDSLLAN